MLSRNALPPLVWTLAALSLGCGTAEPPDLAFPAPSNILLITVDTLRADHLSSYGYARETSPILDDLAATGVRFANATVQWPKTGPSFASIFTATYPKDNGIVRKVGIRLPDAFRMLAEELQGLGYGTHAVVANGAVGSEFNFDQGFDDYLESWKLASDDAAVDPNRAEQVTDLAIGLSERIDRERPWFLWVHYLDPHFPYTPPEDADRFVGDALWSDEPRLTIDASTHRRDMLGIGRSQALEGRDELAFYVARYDAEIAYADAQIGRLLEHLRGEGLLDGTLTAFTADHGESLGEHEYYFDHGRFGFQTCLRVPLILQFPGVLQPAVYENPVPLVDLAPTLLEAAGKQLEGGIWMQGRSLLHRLGGAPGSDDPGVDYVFSEAGYATGGRWQKVVRDARYKLILAPTIQEQRWIGGEGVDLALYDLASDPGETRNLADSRPEELERLRRTLYNWYRPGSFDVMVDQGNDIDSEEMDEKTREQLKALGYLD